MTASVYEVRSKLSNRVCSFGYDDFVRSLFLLILINNNTWLLIHLELLSWEVLLLMHGWARSLNKLSVFHNMAKLQRRWIILNWRMLNINVLSKVLVIVILNLTVRVIIIVGVVNKWRMFLYEAESACSSIDKLVVLLTVRLAIALLSCLWRLLLFLNQSLLGLVKQLFLFLKSRSNLWFIFLTSRLLWDMLVIKRCNVQMRLQIWWPETWRWLLFVIQDIHEGLHDWWPHDIRVNRRSFCQLRSVQLLWLEDLFDSLRLSFLLLELFQNSS